MGGGLRVGVYGARLVVVVCRVLAVEQGVGRAGDVEDGCVGECGYRVEVSRSEVLLRDAMWCGVRVVCVLVV